MHNPKKRKAAGGNRAANQSKHGKFSDSLQRKQANSSGLRLPAPTKILDYLGIKYHQKGEWLHVYCPFHKDGKERNPSLNLHAVSGHFRCHACGEKGGDIIAFHMAITGKRFIESARELVAWRAGV